MGDALKAAVGPGYWEDFVASTVEKFIRPKALNSLLGPVAANDYKAMSPALAMMLEQGKESLMAGGTDLVWDHCDNIPEPIVVNPYKGWTADRWKGLTQFKLDWGTVVQPMKLYGWDEIINAGEEKKVDWLATKIEAHYLGWSAMLAMLAMGDGTNIYDYKTKALKAVTKNDPTAMPISGLGFGNSAVNGAWMSSTNKIAGQDRSVLSNIQAHIFDAQNAAHWWTGGDFANANQLTFKHLNWVLNRTNVNMIKPNLIICGTPVWERLWDLANQKSINTQVNGVLYDYGFQNFKLGGVTIVEDINFQKPDEINFINTQYFKYLFQEGKEVVVSKTQWMPMDGVEVYYMELRTICQLVGYYPQLFGKIYNFSVA